MIFHEEMCVDIIDLGGVGVGNAPALQYNIV